MTPYTFLTDFIVWFPPCLFTFGIIPQILLNFKRKSTEGLSDFMLLIFFIGYLQETPYTFILNMPLAYKIMTPLAFFFVTILILQHLWYGDRQKNAFFIKAMKIILLLFMLELPALLMFPRNAGLLFGWTATVAWATYQIPQFLKILKLRSTEGLSVLFVCVYLLAQVTEATIALALSLPLPTLFNGIRGFFTSSSLLVLFYYFRKQ
jgi:uncharacterized protein with PQ loop repeat